MSILLKTKNLYSFVVAPASSGKGVLYFAKELGMAQDDFLMEKYQEIQKNYKKARKVYERDSLFFNRGKLKEVPIEPISEAKKVFYIPANSSSAKLIKQLRDNGGQGILFEFEADTLWNVLKQDWGGYSDILRNAAHHECISYSRSGNDELVKLRSPRLSICLSGTPDQVGRLIPSAENGLFSRFLFYYFSNSEKWKYMTARKPIQEENGFKKGIALEVKTMIHFLEKHPTHFELHHKQEKRFNAHFENTLDRINKNIGTGVLSTVKRLGFLTFRIAMLLTAIRKFEDQNTALDFICTDHDFDLAIRITEIYLSHALFIYQFLPKSKQSSFEQKQVDIQDFYASLPVQFKRSEAVRIGHSLGFSRSKADRLLALLIPKYLKRQRHENYGYYLKVEVKEKSA